jgi:nucleotide-binding universal stress UspA family protein
MRYQNEESDAVKDLIVPVDGSPESWVAFDVALSLARRCDATVRLVEVVFAPADVVPAQSRMNHHVAHHDHLDVEVTIDVRLSVDSVAAEVERLLELHPGSVVTMASHGRGRSAAIVGSVTEDVLQRTFGPVLLVGPHVEVDDFSGAVVVTVDGSDESEAALPLAAAWATELRATPWIVNVAGQIHNQADADLFDTAYTSRLARDLQMLSGHPVQFDELHATQPAVAVADYATQLGASLIVASSHGRTGWSLLTMGSTTSGFVRHATCPVLVIRLPHPPAEPADVDRWAWSF